MAIPQSFIDELIARADVVEIVGRYVQLKKTGANFQGLCPFHAEKSPSFTVSPTKQFYHCFGCGQNGNAIRFLMEHAGMGFPEAVKDLAGQYGMQVPDEDVSPAERVRQQEQKKKQATLTDVLEKAGTAYRKHLRSSPKAVAYFKKRGVSGEVAKAFGLGYAPEGWRSLASVFPAYDDPLLAESGLVIVNEEDGKRYDRFRDRVMFPIRNVKGECIGFGGRVLGDDKPKYLNSPETPVFSKGRELYGLFEARNAIRDAGYVLVTEGYMDVVALAQLGFPQAVATLGTACTGEHIQKLFRFTDNVVFSFDGDAAGRRAARKALDGALPYATDVRNVKFLFLPSEHDPDSFIREHGGDAFARYVGDATPLSRFLVESSRDGCDLSTAEGRAHMAANAKPLWTQLPDGALKRQLLTEIAELAQLPAAELGELWQERGSGKGRSARPDGSHRSDDAYGDGDWPDASYHVESDAGGGSWHEPSPQRRQGGGGGKRRWKGRRDEAPPPRMQGRGVPVNRATRALQILFAEPAAWDRLSNDEHHLLCELPEPHGPLFTWLDSQHHDHGPQPWEVLQEALQGHGFEQVVRQELAKVPAGVDSDPAELADILAKEKQSRREDEMKRLAAAATTDPAAFARYKALLEQQKPGPKP
ncbi:DNA primase [Ramlibacter sp. G-1-2-2]|uniref:DNA primase n=1 Tax=Ramlibacter agri TaxID=2728837 RepID=A0A848H5M4_9BURK|nr:DNA primase [Ramlibacter agri]NML46095.1 DNA primase [Ramlibacter agri]